jgi:hypothetical protein
MAAYLMVAERSRGFVKPCSEIVNLIGALLMPHPGQSNAGLCPLRSASAMIGAMMAAEDGELRNPLDFSSNRACS